MKFGQRGRISNINYIFYVLFFITIVTINSSGSSMESSVANGTECIECHDTYKVENVPISSGQEILNTDGQHSIGPSENPVSSALLEGEGPDCVNCHNINGIVSIKHVDVSAMKQGVHGQLNNGTMNTTALSDMINKACWACHGNGTEPLNGHPENYAMPYSCENCHGKSANLSYTNLSIIPVLSLKKVYEHIQPPYYENIASTAKSINADCTGCHDKSKIAYSDSGFSLQANVSHYASKITSVSPSINCGLCHKNFSNANEYWANKIRHPARSSDDAFCDNCHNTTPASDLHSQPLAKPGSIHMWFDWQDDDDNELSPSGTNEACYSCHYGGHATGYAWCEDCHVENKTGPAIFTWSRSDLNDTIPKAFAHTNFSNTINVPNQSQVYPQSPSSRTSSSCYAFNSVTGEGTCHGNSYKNISASGGYYAFRTSSEGRSSPYHTTYTIDRMPDTTNCTFCHDQPDQTIRKAWGNGTQITAGTHNWYMENNNSKCWNCHVSTGDAPKDFHSVELSGGGGSDCISCHVDGSPGDVNRTAFGQGVHVDINTTLGTGQVNNSDCWTCHYLKDMNRNNIRQCEDCHTGAGLPDVLQAPKVLTHLPSVTNYSCANCHSKVIIEPGAGIPNVTSHYLKRPTVTSVNYCDYCHGPNANSPFNATNKTIPAFSHDNTSWNGNATCRTCHINSSVSADPLANDTSSFHDFTTELGDAYNGTAKADCIICHVLKSPQFVAAPSPTHDINGYEATDCRNCHTSGTGTDPQKLHSVTAFATGGCIACHSNVNTGLFGKHANINLSGGPDNVTDDDCKTCHFGSALGTMKMKSGAANSSNTYFCDACHTSAGTGPIHPTDTNLIKDGLQHGSTNCQWCHIAGDTLARPLINENETLNFHPNGPKGTASGKNCLSCHLNPTPIELLFHAPLEKHETDMNNCIYCHDQADNHGVTRDPPGGSLPNVLSLSVTTPVTSGTESQVQATISDDYMRMAAARYQVTNNSGVVIDWTDMNPLAGFEYVNASIDTSGLLGDYNVNVKGMAWAPKAGSVPYYPLNGQWSGISTRQLTVVQPTGYGNGTVYGILDKKIAGAIVSTNTSVSVITDQNGAYSLSLPDGTYRLTASKEPEYYSNSSVVVTVTAYTTVNQDIVLTPRPTGNISGTVRIKHRFSQVPKSS